MKIGSLVLHSSHTEVLFHFYSQTLELPVVAGDEGFTITLPYSTIQFKKSKEPFTYHFALLVPANRIEEARDWLTARTELLWIKDYGGVIAEFVNWKARSVYFLDPAGNIVELIARHDLHNETADPFGASQILAVSEVGMVFPAEAIEKETKKLCEEFDLRYFSRQKPFPQFKALGDDEGLFIVVTANRPWYPTESPSVLAPVQVSFEQGGKMHSIQL
jgi:hypothetical protein